MLSTKPTTEEWDYSTKISRTSAVLSALAAVAILISYVIHIQNLAMHQSPAATAAVAVFSGGFFWVRLILLGIGAVAVAFVSFRLANVDGLGNPTPLATTAVLGLIFDRCRVHGTIPALRHHVPGHRITPNTALTNGPFSIHQDREGPVSPLAFPRAVATPPSRLVA